MNPRKKRRIEEALRRELSNIILRDMNDPRAGFVTLTGVNLSEDQRSATVRLTIRGTPDEARQTLSVLLRARGYMQALIGQRLSLRYTPVLSFAEDKELLEALRIERLIDEARRKDRDFRETPETS